MKNHGLKLFYAIAIGIALAACGGAHAGTLPHNVVADDGKVFSVDNAITIEKVPNAVLVLYSNGTTYSFADSTGAVYNKVTVSPGFAGRFAQAPGTLKHVNVVEVIDVICYSTQSAFVYPHGSLQPVLFQDGCAFHAAVKAAAS